MSDEEKADQMENLAYRIGAEGFDYCFRDYSEFKEIDDQKFQALRKQYVDAADALEAHVRELCGSVGIDTEDQF